MARLEFPGTVVPDGAIVLVGTAQSSDGRAVDLEWEPAGDWEWTAGLPPTGVEIEDGGDLVLYVRADISEGVFIKQTLNLHIQTWFEQFRWILLLALLAVAATAGFVTWALARRPKLVGFVEGSMLGGLVDLRERGARKVTLGSGDGAGISLPQIPNLAEVQLVFVARRAASGWPESWVLIRDGALRMRVKGVLSDTFTGSLEHRLRSGDMIELVTTTGEAALSFHFDDPAELASDPFEDF